MEKNYKVVPHKEFGHLVYHKDEKHPIGRVFKDETASKKYPWTAEYSHLDLGTGLIDSKREALAMVIKAHKEK